MATIKKVNGFYSHSDSYLRRMNKQELIEYIRTIEKNWENSLITNEIQYHNCIKLLAEERNKVIDEFATRLKINKELGYIGYLDRVVNEIAEQMKGGAE